MSCIRHAISKVKQIIPQAILEKTFSPKQFNWFEQSHYNLDREIEHKVIRQIVLPDCNVVGGKEVAVLIGDLPREQVNNEIIIRIPKNRTQNRSIVSVTDIVFASLGTGGFYPSSYVSAFNSNMNRNDQSAMMGSVRTAMAALDTIPLVSTSSAELIADNVIMIQNTVGLTANSMARVIVEYDDQLSNISARSWNHFAKLVEYAVKAKIYNDLIVRIDTAELQGGFNLGIFKEIVSGYSEAQENYQTYLKGIWARVALMNDRPRHERFLKSIIGGQFK